MADKHLELPCNKDRTKTSGYLKPTNIGNLQEQKANNQKRVKDGCCNQNTTAKDMGFSNDAQVKKIKIQIVNSIITRSAIKLRPPALDPNIDNIDAMLRVLHQSILNYETLIVLFKSFQGQPMLNHRTHSNLKTCQLINAFFQQLQLKLGTNVFADVHIKLEMPWSEIMRVITTWLKDKSHLLWANNCKSNMYPPLDGSCIPTKSSSIIYCLWRLSKLSP